MFASCVKSGLFLCTACVVLCEEPCAKTGRFLCVICVAFLCLYIIVWNTEVHMAARSLSVMGGPVYKMADYDVIVLQKQITPKGNTICNVSFVKIILGKPLL